MLAAVAIATIVSLFALAVRSWRAHKAGAARTGDDKMESGGDVKVEKDDGMSSAGHIRPGIAMAL